MRHPSLHSAAPKRPWQRSTIGAALLGVFLLTPVSVWALTLGGMRVQSAIGEPLNAELSLGQLTPEELSSLRVDFAPMTVYQSAGIVSNRLLNSIQIGVDASSPSNVLVKLTSTRPMTEPSLSMMLEIQWASGKVVRDYTLMFNPEPSIVLNIEPLFASAPTEAAPAPIEPQTPRVDVVPEAAPTPDPAPPPTPTPSEPRRLLVKPGDTAGALALANLPASVSLDQMLQAMLRANPQAFVGYNVNRLKAGAALVLPSTEAALAIEPTLARQLLVAQSRDFNAYRRSLAANATQQPMGPAGQSVTGRVETQVQDQANRAASPDQLTLSKGSATSGAESEAQIATAQKTQDEQSQVAGLQRNIDDLKALSEDASKAGTGAVDSTMGTDLVKPEPSNKDQPLQRLIAQPWALPAAAGLLLLLFVLFVVRLIRGRKNEETSSPMVPADNTFSEEDQANVATVNGMSFDFSNLNLDLNDTQSPVFEPEAAPEADPDAMAAKFELAKEFLSLGDRVAAKALALDIHAQATGLLKTRVELFLAELD